MSVFKAYTMIQSITVALSIFEHLQVLARITMTDMGQTLSVMGWTEEGSRVVVVAKDNVVRNIRNMIELEKYLEEKYILVQKHETVKIEMKFFYIGSS